MTSSIELLSPAGDFSSLSAALSAGCSSIYFGLSSLNMRSYSSKNFSIDDLPEIVSRCSTSGVRCYLTLNSIIYDNDLSLMRELLSAAVSAGVSAVIASDIAVMKYACSLGMPVHLSTQLNISNIESLSFYSRYADVVVLARELNLDQIRHITSTISERNICGPSGKLVRVELFCHGALCMSISGKCYLSLHAMDQSANRGACMQLCRRRYLVRDMDSDLELSVENPCIMSPKDLKTIHFLNHIIESGVSILKIEGRARNAEYVSEVTSCYREAIDAYAAGTYDAAKVAKWDERLSTVFNRGFWDGYYLGKRLGEWSSSYGSVSTKRKIYVGRVLKYYSHLGVGEFILESGALHVGDEIWITGPTTGALHQSITEIRIEDVPSAEVSKGIIFSMPTVSKIRPSDRVYLFA